MTILQAIVLGLIQGIAEFLPISSSGHLSIFQNFFGLNTAENESMFFDVLLHLATLVSVCTVYRRDIAEIISQLLDCVRGIGHPVPGSKKRYPAVRLLIMMFFATLPLFAILPVKDLVEKLYYSTAFIGIALILTGCMLYVGDRMSRGAKDERSMSVGNALFVGLCQAIATVPGLSRSGTTITAGMAAGLNREFAVKFSFLISIPAVLGANILSLVDALKEGIDFSQLPAYLLGMLVAGVSGYFAISLVRYITRKNRFGYFAYYCWLAGAVTLILTIVL